MNENDMVRARIRDDGRVVQILNDGRERPVTERRTDWDAVSQMTDDDAEYNALMDPDSAPSLSEQDRVAKASMIDARVVRRRLKLTQAAFASRYSIPLGTLRDWERGARFPDSAARAYLRIISEDPETVASLLARADSRRAGEPLIA